VWASMKKERIWPTPPSHETYRREADYKCLLKMESVMQEAAKTLNNCDTVCMCVCM